jgi:hypothetical protein
VLEDRNLLDGQILTINRFVPHISTVPAIFGDHVRLYVREKVQENLAGHAPVVLFAHGATISALPSFDLQFRDYSFMDYLAGAMQRESRGPASGSQPVMTLSGATQKELFGHG